MATDHRPDVDDCTTTGSFADHGIDDGVDLVGRTHTRLVASEDDDVAFHPTGT